MIALHEIHIAIDARVQAIRENRPDWPCSKGCDTCCRSLADIPRLTETEWVLLKEGLTALPAGRLAEITRNTAALSEQKTRPVVCPMLDQATGACPVYMHRPVACRSYGFYVQREKGMYCSDIEARVADGSLADVVWGNHDAVDQQLSGQGEARALTDWFWRWGNEGQ
jgi:Fe-S-cluster containining protein